MHLYNKLSLILNESPLDVVRPNLDPEMFDDKEELKPEVTKFLKDIVNDIDENVTPVVGKALIKGSILSYQWLPYTDVDLLIEIDEKVNDHQWDLMGDQLEERYGGLVIPGTKHPLEVFLQRGKYNMGNADGVYDLYKGWLKGPYTHEVDLSHYMSQFEEIAGDLDIETGELKRDIIDFNLLNNLPKDEIKGIKASLKAKLDEINQNVEDLINKRDKVKSARSKAFEKEMTPTEIKKYGSKNLLPANIIQKMLERYHYMGFLSEIKDLHDDGKIDEEDMEELTSIFNLDNAEN